MNKKLNVSNIEASAGIPSGDILVFIVAHIFFFFSSLHSRGSSKGDVLVLNEPIELKGVWLKGMP